MSDPAVYESDTEEPAAPEKLSLTLWQRMMHLIGLPERTAEEHAEMADLHAKATAYVSAWKADPEAAFGHLVTVADRLTQSMKAIVAQVPALAGLGGVVSQADAALDRVANAIVEPQAPPPLPPPPAPPEAVEKPIEPGGDPNLAPPPTTQDPPPPPPWPNVTVPGSQQNFSGTTTDDVGR
jgi:hypothetical protein